MYIFSHFFSLLSDAVSNQKGPASKIIIEEFGQNPFLILISCLLSLRTRDVITLQVSRALFDKAQTPEEVLSISIHDLEKIVYKTGFYRRKAQVLRLVSDILIKKYNGMVPSDKQLLLELPGVGLKTANLVLAEAFDIPAICVDTHVHRLSNMLNLVHTQTPEETEKVLSIIIPDSYQRDFARYMVLLGQKPRAFQREFIQKYFTLIS